MNGPRSAIYAFDEGKSMFRLQGLAFSRVMQGSGVFAEAWKNPCVGSSTSISRGESGGFRELKA
jgi:hypothetical protein